MTYKELREIILSKGYRWFEGKPYNANIIFKRTSNVFTNKLDDIGYVAYLDNNNKECLVEVPATTKAGFSPALFNPKVVMGVKGTAVIVPGQYLSSWEFRDSYVGWLQYPYFAQIKPIKVYRDPDGDKEIDEVQVQEGLFGINLHKMGNAGVLTNYLGNWSEGCCGWHPDDMAKYILPVIRESVKRYGIIFSATIIK